MHKAARHFDWKGRIETLEERRVMSADPLMGGTIVHHAFEEDAAPPLEHQLVSEPDFWLDVENLLSLEDQLNQIEQTLYSAHNTTGLNSVVANYGFTGVGQTVAVIDSGIAYDHFALGGGFGANYKVVGGWDFSGENDANPYDDGPSGSHGTHVAGIVGGTAGNDKGVAPGVDLVALRVFDDSGAGYFSWVENALRWVINNRTAFENPITAINLSLGVSSWNATTVPSWSTLEDEFATLKAAGVFIAVSAGNGFTTYNEPGLSYPAASPHVVPVMSVTDAGALASYSQRATHAIGAPGSAIRSTVPDYKGDSDGAADDYANFSGTSMASPYIAGASVLIRQAMEFAGYTNITQDTIYDHMMDTAVSFVDTVTGLTFQRLNLGAAIDALMPADDFGSTVTTAHNLGSLTGSRSLDGTIGTVSDADYFTFTAGSNGSVTFEVFDTTHSMDAAWTLSNGTGTLSNNGDTFSFDVVAGQTYTVGLSSSGGIGHYSLDVTLENSFAYTDWGTVSFSQLNGLSVNGEVWYRVAASKTGYLTVEGLFDAQSGQVSMQLYDSNLLPLATGNSVNGTCRVDAYASAGEAFYVCVTGTNSSVNYRLSNLVSVVGTTVNVAGTADNDTFAFTAGNTHTVTVNGVAHSFASVAVNAFNFSGGSGSDTIVMTGTSGDETVRLDVGQITMSGTSYSVLATSVENVTAKGGGGADRVDLYDSASDDVLTTLPTQVALSGSGYSNTAEGFAQAWAWASTGHDIAYTYDSAGDDLFRQWSTHFASSGTGFFNYGRGFDESFAYSSSGHDRAILYDSAGDDLFRAWTDHHVYSGVGFVNYIRGYDNVQAYATQGSDRAVFYDSAGNDQMKLWIDKAVMFGTGYFNYVSSFDRVEAYATTGNDRVTFFDSAGNDWFRSWGDKSVMMGGGVFNYSTGFDSTYAYSEAGNDRADLFATGLNASIQVNDGYATLTGTGFYNYVASFENIYRYTSSGTLEPSVASTPLVSAQVIEPKVSVLPTGLSSPAKTSVQHTINRSTLISRIGYYDFWGQDQSVHEHRAKADRQRALTDRACDTVESATEPDGDFAGEIDLLFDVIGRGVSA